MTHRPSHHDPLMTRPAASVTDAPLAGDQLTFGSLRASQRPPRLPTPSWRQDQHAEAVHRGLESGAQRDADHERIMSRIKSLYVEFLRGLGVGAFCYAQDFTEWLRGQGQLPSDDVFDMRSTSSLWVRAVQVGVLERDGYGPNGGGERSSSTVRMRYRVVRVPALSESGGSEG